MLSGPGAYDPPGWYIPFENMQAVADELRCSVRQALADDPISVELRRYATLKLLAHKQSAERAKPAEGATGKGD